MTVVFCDRNEFTHGAQQGASSSMSACSLGIDLGTGSVKAVLIDATGAQLSVASAPVPLSRPQPGWVETNPEDWWLAAQTAVRDALDRSPAQVCAVGLSGQMHGVVLARGDSRPLRPAIISLDRRAEAESRALPRPAGPPLVVSRQPAGPGNGGAYPALADH